MESEVQTYGPGDTHKSVRTVPTQARADLMVNSLLDAAASLIDRSGYESLSTQEVASEVGCSIGTLYRYFPDRIAVLQRLALRNVKRFDDEYIQTINSATHNERRDAVRAVFQQFAAAFLGQPGFRSLRFGDSLDLVAGENIDGIAAISMHLAAQLDSVYGAEAPRSTTGNSSAENALVARLEIALTTFDALLVRGFASNRLGDPFRVRDAHSAMREYSFA